MYIHITNINTTVQCHRNECARITENEMNSVHLRWTWSSWKWSTIEWEVLGVTSVLWAQLVVRWGSLRRNWSSIVPWKLLPWWQQLKVLHGKASSHTCGHQQVTRERIGTKSPWIHPHKITGITPSEKYDQVSTWQVYTYTYIQQVDTWRVMIRKCHQTKATRILKDHEMIFIGEQGLTYSAGLLLCTRPAHNTYSILYSIQQCVNESVLYAAYNISVYVYI